MNSDFLTPRQVAQLCGLSYHTILRAIKHNELKATRIRNRLKVPQWALDEWIDTNMVEAPCPEKLIFPKFAPPKPPPRGSLDRLRMIELDRSEAA